MDLSKGAIFFQVPPGSGGAKIHAAAITAAITGTSGFVERVGDTYKLIVLEGDVRVYSTIARASRCSCAAARC